MLLLVGSRAVELVWMPCVWTLGLVVASWRVTVLCLCLRCAELGCALQVGVGPTGARPNLNIAIVWCGWSAREQGKSSRHVVLELSLVGG